MDIKNLQNALASNRANDAYKTQERAGANTYNATEASKSAPTDRVTLTTVSSQLRELEKKANDTNISNESKIAELKNAIANGSYKVDAEKIADKLIQTEILFAKA